MYGGRNERQPADPREFRGSRARVAVAALLGVAASLLPWPSSRAELGQLGRIEILAPHGAVREPPRSVCWSAAERPSWIRVCVRDDRGAVAIARTVAAPGKNTLPFTAEERRTLATMPSAHVEIAGLSEGGELIAMSAAARFARFPPGR